MKRYAILLASALGAAALLLLFGRLATPGRETGALERTRPAVPLEITVTPDRRIAPSTASVPKDHRVLLVVHNGSQRPAKLQLMGYEDRLRIEPIPPDSVWRGEFLADRPGEDFAWVLGGTPVGRLLVTGSHLEEDHR